MDLLENNDKLQHSNTRLKKRLKALRIGLNLTQTELAKKARLSLRHIQDIEAGKVDIRISTLEALASALNVKAYQLICIEPPKSIIQKTLFSKNYESPLKPNSTLLTPYCALDEMDLALQICDTEGLILYINAKASEIRGATRDQVAQKYYLWDFLCTHKEKEDLKKYLKFIIKEQPIPTPYINKNKTLRGETFFVKVDWSFLKDKKGKVKGFFSVFNDPSTEHETAKLSLKPQERFFYSFLNFQLFGLQK